MYRIASTAGLVASPVKVVTARAFQSVITVGSSAGIVGGHRRRCRCGRRAGGQGGKENGGREGSKPGTRMRAPAADWWGGVSEKRAHVAPPRCAVPVVEGGAPTRVACSP